MRLKLMLVTIVENGLDGIDAGPRVAVQSLCNCFFYRQTFFAERIEIACDGSYGKASSFQQRSATHLTGNDFNKGEF